METASVRELAAAALRGDIVIDVRTPDEFEAGHVPGSTLIPLPHVPLRVSEIPRRGPAYVVCESGNRAYQACEYLRQRGYRPINVRGGMAEYRKAGLPMRTRATVRAAS